MYLGSLLILEDEMESRREDLHCVSSLPVFSDEQYDCTQSAARTGLMESSNTNRAARPINEDANVRSMVARE